MIVTHIPEILGISSYKLVQEIVEIYNMCYKRLGF